MNFPQIQTIRRWLTSYTAISKYWNSSVNLLIKIGSPIVILALGFGAFFLLDLAKPEPEKKTEPPRPLSVYIEPAERRDISLRVKTGGEVRSRTAVNIVSQVAGRIVSVSAEFTEGGNVTPGVSFVEIDDRDYQLALSSAEASVAEAEVGVQEAVAQADVARKQLRNAKNASPLALKLPQVAQAYARLKAAQAILQRAELDLDRTKIALPFTGRISEKMVGIGQYVGPGTMIGQAFATDVVQIRLPLTDTQLASLGLPIGFVAVESNKIPVELTAVVAGKIQSWQGHLTRLDASIDSTTRTLFGLVEVQDPYGTNSSQHAMPLAVGLYVNAEIFGRQISNATVIPRQALRAGDNVFVLNDQQRLEIRNVTVVHSTETEAVIGTGVQPHERVIISSIRNPIPGMNLTPLTEVRESVATRGEV
ncbi:MAG: RND family efflux transporter MFP subunit [Patiriisocius sp.]